ncbi:MAG: hypothetical protein KAG19_04640 [Methylococcales bacterium]|nr:hypothetical protein [Methylococcales bacterium]
MLSSLFTPSTLKRYEWPIITLSIALLTFVLYGHALDGYWRFDDGVHLMFSLEYSPWQYFFNPEITRAQSGSNVTPWNVFFYDINLSLFGFHPSGFYLHLLALMTATAASLYTLLRLWLPRSASSFGTLIFLMGRPSYHLTQELMSAHYLTGMLFSLLSLICLTHYLRDARVIKLVLATLFYALATSCKEIYVPLMALFFVIPAGHLKQRIYSSIPFVFVAIIYALWRHTVLGAWVGGYANHSIEPDYLVIIQQLSNIPLILFDDNLWGILAVVVILSFSGLAIKNRLLNVSLTATTLFILLVPLIPLTLSQGLSLPDRYLFAPSLALSVWLAVISQSFIISTSSAFKWIQAVGVCLLILVSFLSYFDERQYNKGVIQKSEDFYRGAIELSASQNVLVLDQVDNGDYWEFVISEARHAYNLFHQLPHQPPLIIVDTLSGLLLLEDRLKSRQLSPATIQFYQHRKHTFIPLDIKPLIQTIEQSLKAGQDKLLTVRLTHKDNRLSWAFLPHDATYSAILWQGKSNQQYPILKFPATGSYPWAKGDEISISIVFKGAEGWQAVTPRLSFPSGKKYLNWQGKTELNTMLNQLKILFNAQVGKKVLHDLK